MKPGTPSEWFTICWRCWASSARRFDRSGVSGGWWGMPHFQALWTRTPGNWLKTEAFLLGLANAVTASARIERQQGTRVPCWCLLRCCQLCSKGQSRGCDYSASV